MECNMYMPQKVEVARLQNKSTPEKFLLYNSLQFPNAVVLNAVGRRNTQMSANAHKRAQTQVRKRGQKGKTEPLSERKRALPRKNCKQPGSKEPGLRTRKIRCKKRNCTKTRRDVPENLNPNWHFRWRFFHCQSQRRFRFSFAEWESAGLVVLREWAQQDPRVSRCDYFA